MPTQQSKFGFDLDRLRCEINRVLWYGAAEATAFMLIATCSRRLMWATEPWALLVPGLAIGFVLATVGKSLRSLEVVSASNGAVILAVMLTVGTGMCMLLSLVVGQLHVSLAGSVVTGILGALVGLVLYVVFDAPGTLTHD